MAALDRLKSRVARLRASQAAKSVKKAATYLPTVKPVRDAHNGRVKGFKLRWNFRF